VSNLVHLHCYLKFKNNTNCVNVNETVTWFQVEINVTPCHSKRKWLRTQLKKTMKHISTVQLISCRSTTGAYIGLKVLHDSSLATHLSCNIITSGASYSRCLIKRWLLDIDKDVLKFIVHTEDGSSNVLCGGMIGYQGGRRNACIYMMRPVLGKANV